MSFPSLQTFIGPYLKLMEKRYRGPNFAARPHNVLLIEELSSRDKNGHVITN